MIKRRVSAESIIAEGASYWRSDQAHTQKQKSNKEKQHALLRHDVARLNHTVYDRDITARYAIDGDVARLVALARRVREKQQVAAVERGFHRSAAGV